MANRSEIYTSAGEELDRLVDRLRGLSREELLTLIDHPMTSALEISGKKFSLGAWAELRDGDRLSVVAEVRRNFILGMSKVQAVGFFVEPEGHITPMIDKDLWAHGY